VTVIVPTVTVTLSYGRGTAREEAAIVETLRQCTRTQLVRSPRQNRAGYARVASVVRIQARCTHPRRHQRRRRKPGCLSPRSFLRPFDQRTDKRDENVRCSAGACTHAGHDARR
jgi:hypothetical protein